MSRTLKGVFGLLGGLALLAMIGVLVSVSPSEFGSLFQTAPVVEETDFAFDTAAAWMLAYKEWVGTEAAVYPLYQSDSDDFKEGGTFEGVRLYTEAFLDALDHPAKVSYLLLYKGITFIEVEEQIPGVGEVWWLLVYAYDPVTGWELIDVHNQLGG